MECSTCSNKQPCPCSNESCPNHSRCCECVAQHRAMGNLPVCLRNLDKDES